MPVDLLNTYGPKIDPLEDALTALQGATDAAGMNITIGANRQMIEEDFASISRWVLDPKMSWFHKNGKANALRNIELLSRAWRLYLEAGL